MLAGVLAAVATLVALRSLRKGAAREQLPEG